MTRGELKMTTSVSSYRSGSPRFGTKDTGPINSEVKTYMLPPEELEKYRNGADKKMAGKGNLEEAKRLLTETDLPISEIVKRTETNKLTVRTYAQQLRKQKHKDCKVDSLVQKDELKSILAENNHAKKQLADATSKLQSFETERDTLKDEISQLKEELVTKTNDSLDLENELKELRGRLSAKETVFEATSKDEEIKLLRDSNDYLYQENLALKVRARAYKTAIRELIADQGV